MFKTIVTFVISSFMICFLYAQEPTQIIRYPSINPDGSQVAFAYQGDIWVHDLDQGVSARLTIHEAYEHSPQWSPDGTSIVFSSNRFGNNDLFTIDANGRNLMRLTHHSASDYGARWIDNETILFSTRRNYAQIERENEYYTISKSGGTPVRHSDVLGLDAAYDQSGQYMALVRGTCRMEREAYTGPADRDVWLYNKAQNSYKQITSFEGQDTAPDWGPDGQLYYLSAQNGKYNIYKHTLSTQGALTGDHVQVTDYTTEGIDYFDVSYDGSTIVYTQASKVYIMNTGDDHTPVELKLSLTEDYRFDPEEYINYSNRVEGFSLSPDEKHIAFGVRGEIFVKQNNEDKKMSVAPSAHPTRDGNAQWLNDTTLLFLSDRDGDYDLYKVQAKTGGDIFESFEWTTTKVLETPAEEDYFEISPDRSQVAVATVEGTLSIIDVDTMGVMSAPRVLIANWQKANDLSWSPDSKWIAYAQTNLDFNSEIFIRKSDGSNDPVNVSMHPRGDTDPIWSPDGSKLGFVSIRNNGDADIWFAWLTEENYERTQSDWEDLDEPKDKGHGGDVEIDLDGIHERLVQVTRMPGNEGDLLISKDGETFYFSTNGGSRQGNTGDPEFKKVKWDGDDMETVLSDGNISRLNLDQKGKNIYYIKRGGSMMKISAEGKKPTSLPFSAQMKVDYLAERQQIFDEAWRTLRDRFYDPQFHGQDWDALRDQYESRALAASTKQDFMYIFNQMLGQLNASHMGLRGRGDEDTQEVRTGLLGIEVSPVSSGVQVMRVVPGSPADKRQSKLEIGQVITAVNGVRIGNQNFYGLVNQTVDDRIQLTMSDGEKVIIRPASSMRTLLYEEWVDDRKALVDQYSGGRLGYIHIRGMNWSSFEAFERELMASGYGKDGVVIDVRYNGGGWTTDMVMAVLNVKQHSYTVPRGASDDLQKDHLKYREHYPYGERLPLSSWTKPAIALCNENSYSNAEIFSHAFKTLGHGSLVGQPTFGAVISTGGRSLMDGFFVRVPFRAWYVKATDENMEHGPAVPDYIVENSPDGRANNIDEQLQKSVEVLLSQIDGE